jgi:hypothetical protein
MRRGSLIGPLLIILIGVWFLISSLQPDLPLLDIAADYWPYLLIAWGALRLLEILVWAARSRPVPRCGVSGGEWTAIVFICLIGSFLFQRPWQHVRFFRDWAIDSFGHAYYYPVPEQQKPAGKAPRITVENLYGSTRVVGADVQEIKVSGRKTVRALRDNLASAADQQSPVEISTQGEQVVVRTNQDRVTGQRRVSTDLELTVPRGSSLQGRGRQGDFEISAITGSVDLSSDNAEVRLQNLEGDVRLDLRWTDLIRAFNVKGSVEVTRGRGRRIELENISGLVTINGSYFGDLQFRNLAKPLRYKSDRTDLRVEKLPGQIESDRERLTGSKLVGPIVLTTRSRDVQLEDFSESLELSLELGDIILRPAQMPLARIDARTQRGRVELALPPSASFQLKAATGRGELENDFGPPLATEREGRGGSLQGAVGKGPSITLSTNSGSISIRKDSGAPLLPRSGRDRASVEITTEKGRLRVQEH